MNFWNADIRHMSMSTSGIQKNTILEICDFLEHFVPYVLTTMCLMSAFQYFGVFQKFNITPLSYFNLMHFGHIFAILSSFYRSSLRGPASPICDLFLQKCKKRSFFSKMLKIQNSTKIKILLQNAWDRSMIGRKHSSQSFNASCSVHFDLTLA